MRLEEHLIPDSEKGREWILKKCKEYWKEYDSLGGFSMYNHREKYRVYRDYAMSKQSVSKYKKLLNVDESGDQSLLSIDFTPIGIPTKFRQLALSITKKVDFEIGATPIDTLAQDQIDKYFRKQEAKIRQRFISVTPTSTSCPLRWSSGSQRYMSTMTWMRSGPRCGKTFSSVASAG